MKRVAVVSEVGFQTVSKPKYGLVMSENPL